MDKFRETKFEHVMLDIETLGQGPCAPVVQIGLVAFDPVTGETARPLEVSVFPDFKRFEPDASTLVWWLKQGREAREAVFFGGTEIVTVEDAARRVDAWFAWPFLDHEKGVKVWAKPPSFDVVILENFLRVGGVDVPWKYHAPRCVRTLMELAGMRREDAVKSELNHSAVHDAIAQAKTVVECYRILDERGG